MSNRPLIILTGPTAAGKTDISIRLAEKLGGEIISADSMQVYRRMDIGTAKIRKEEMNGIPHHGGTGFYIQALLYDIDFSEEHSDGYRESMELIAAEPGGPDKLFEELRSVDPASCEIIHKNNVKKVIRALEFYHYNGTPISEHNSVQREKSSAYDSMYLVLTMDREKLYNRIEKRVDIMIENGLVEEVRGLIEEGLDDTYISMQGIGYKEVYEYLKGKCTLEDAIYNIKQNTRHFAKRQLTWFRREKEVIWIDKDTFSSDEEIADHIVDLWRNKHAGE